MDLEKEIKDYCLRYYNYRYPEQYEERTGSEIMPHIVQAAKYFGDWGIRQKVSYNEKAIREVYETLMSAKLALLGITGKETMSEFRRKSENNRTELIERIERALSIIQTQ